MARRARRAAEEIGTPQAQMVKRRAIPFPLQADSPEERKVGQFDTRVLTEVRAALASWLGIRAGPDPRSLP